MHFNHLKENLQNQTLVFPNLKIDGVYSQQKPFKIMQPGLHSSSIFALFFKSYLEYQFVEQHHSVLLRFFCHNLGSFLDSTHCEGVLNICEYNSILIIKT